MKQSIKFFGKDSELNKGYAKTYDMQLEQNAIVSKIMPPIEVLSEYERIMPGITHELMDAIKQSEINDREIDKITQKNLLLLRFFGVFCSTVLLLGVGICGSWIVTYSSSKIWGIILLAIFSGVTIISNLKHFKNLKNFFTSSEPEVKNMEQNYSNKNAQNQVQAKKNMNRKKHNKSNIYNQNKNKKTGRIIIQ